MDQGAATYNGLADEALMNLVCKGERRAFETLYERYFDKLTWFARQYVFDEYQAQDIVQEVFIKIIEQPQLFDREKKFSTWIYTITANRCKNQVRNTQNRSELLNHVKTENHSVLQHEVDYKSLRNTIKKAYSTLNEKEKTLFVLRFEHELPLKEIAEITGAPQGTVKSGIHYLLKKMAYQLKVFTHE